MTKNFVENNPKIRVIFSYYLFYTEYNQFYNVGHNVTREATLDCCLRVKGNLTRKTSSLFIYSMIYNFIF